MEELIPFVQQFYAAYGDGGILALLAAVSASASQIMKLDVVQRGLPEKARWVNLSDNMKFVALVLPTVVGALLGGLGAGLAPLALVAVAGKALMAALLGMGAVKSMKMNAPVARAAVTATRDVLAGRRGLRVPIPPPAEGSYKKFWHRNCPLAQCDLVAPHTNECEHRCRRT